jgi:hypothetical protein
MLNIDPTRPPRESATPQHPRGHPRPLEVPPHLGDGPGNDEFRASVPSQVPPQMIQGEHVTDAIATLDKILRSQQSGMRKTASAGAVSRPG